MKKTVLILLCLVFIPNLLIAQMNLNSERTTFNSLLHEKTYIIEIDDYQVVELIEFKNGEFTGNLINSIWSTTDSEVRIKEIRQKKEIITVDINNLMNELKMNDFETIPDGRIVKGCVFGSGGVTISFTSKSSNGMVKKASYWEPESYAYYRDTTIPEIIKVRKILNIIRAEIDLERQYDEFAYELPDGRYVYSSMVLDKRRKQYPH